MLEQDKKIEYLKNLKEKELVESVLIPLFEQMGFEIVSKGHDIKDKMRPDLILGEKDPFGEYAYTILEAKSGRMSLSRIKKALNQIQMYFEASVPKDSKIKPTKAILVAKGKITPLAIKFFQQSTKGFGLHIKLLDAAQLVELVDKYLPFFFIQKALPDITFHGIVGKSPAMLHLFEMIERVASTKSTVLILGESGTGKELLARAIHQLSKRKGPFVVFSASAIPPELAESEIFGYRKGAFTGAFSENIGILERADGGTLLVDEIGDAHQSLQVKLLRVLQEGAFRRMGSDREITVDVRFIATTSRNLEEMIIRGEFRQDLYYRLNVLPVKMPPLRERKEDIPLLIEYFIQRYIKELAIQTPIALSKEAMKVLMDYDWPGNIRELENAIKRIVVLGGDFSVLEAQYSNFISERKQRERAKRFPKKQAFSSRSAEKPDKPSDIMVEFFLSSGFSIKDELKNDIYIIYSDKPGFKKYGEIPFKRFHNTELSPDTIRRFYEDCENSLSTRDRVAFISIPPQLDSAVALQILVYKSESNFTIVPFTLHNIEKAIQTSSAPREITEAIKLWKGEGDVFDISTPIRDPIWFFGREKVIDEISEYVQSLQFVGIFGLRKMGKTSLLHQLMNRMRENVIAYVDLQSVSKNVASLLSRIANEFIDDIRIKFPDIKLPKRKRFQGDSKGLQGKCSEFIYDLYREVNRIKKDTKFLLFIDEIDYLIPDESVEGIQGYELFLSLARGLAQNYGFLVTIVSGIKPTINDVTLPDKQDMDNPTYNFFKELYLSNLEKNELEEMVNRIGTQIGVTFSPKATSIVYDETSGHPYLSRLLCSATMRVRDKKVKILPNDVKRGLEIFFNAPHFEHGVRQLEYIWKYSLSEHERKIIRKVNESSPSEVDLLNEDERTQHGYKKLIRLGLLCNKSGRLQITPKIFKLYLKTKGYF